MFPLAALLCIACHTRIASIRRWQSSRCQFKNFYRFRYTLSNAPIHFCVHLYYVKSCAILRSQYDDNLKKKPVFSRSSFHFSVLLTPERRRRGTSVEKISSCICPEIGWIWLMRKVREKRSFSQMNIPKFFCSHFSGFLEDFPDFPGHKWPSGGSSVKTNFEMVRYLSTILSHLILRFLPRRCVSSRHSSLIKRSRAIRFA